MAKKHPKPAEGMDLWPDYDLTGERPRTVRRVLLDAGYGLDEKTRGMVQFHVDSLPDERGVLAHTCYLIASRIGYRYPLLKVVEHSTGGYPVNVVADVWPEGVLAGNEAELLKDLGLVFRSDPAKKAVLNLIDVQDSSSQR